MKRIEKVYQVFYKCRHCGEYLPYEQVCIEDNGMGYGITSDMILARLSVRCERAITHKCEDGIYGVMDIEYFKEVK